jgi:hypothetical protein
MPGGRGAYEMDRQHPLLNSTAGSLNARVRRLPDYDAFHVGRFRALPHLSPRAAAFAGSSPSEALL